MVIIKELKLQCSICGHSDHFRINYKSNRKGIKCRECGHRVDIDGFSDTPTSAELVVYDGDGTPKVQIF